MKQSFSFLLLTARGVTGRVLFLLAAMAAVETALAYRALGLLSRGQFADLGDWADAVPFAAGRYEIMSAVQASKMAMIFLLACLLLCLILGINFAPGRQSGQVRYTLHRLSLSPRALIGWSAVCNVLCLTLLWGVQVILSLAFCQAALPHLDPALVNEQTLFTLFCHDTFLHNLLPVTDVPRLVRNVLLVLASSLSLSCLSYLMQYRQTSVSLAGFLPLFLAFSAEPMGHSVFLNFLLAAILVACLILIWKEPSYELMDSPKVPAGE